MTQPRTDAPGPPPGSIPDVPSDVRGPYAPPPGVAPASPPPTPGALDGPSAGPRAPGAAVIERFRPPRSRLPLLVAFGLGVALVGVLAASGVLPGVLPGTAASTPTATAPAAQPSAGGVPFSMPADSSSTGRWEILDRSWDADGVDVRVRVVCLSGQVEYAFRAFPRGSATPVLAKPSERTPGIDSGTLAEGESAEGWLRLTLPREESTFFVTTLAGRMMSAQALKP